MDYDDNFEMSSSSSYGENRSLPRSSNSGISSSKDPNLEQLVEMVLHKLGHMQRPQQHFRQQGYAAQQPASGPYACGICAGPHSIEKCTSYVPGANQPPTKCWCQVCKWNTTHVTQNCLHIARLTREQEGAARLQGNFHGNLQQGYVRHEMAKPVLGVQPPPPGIVPLRYVDAEYQEPTMELVSAPPYYQEPISEWYEPREEFVNMNEQPYVTYPSKTNSMMLVGPMPSRMPQ